MHHVHELVAESLISAGIAQRRTTAGGDPSEAESPAGDSLETGLPAGPASLRPTGATSPGPTGPASPGPTGPAPPGPTGPAPPGPTGAVLPRPTGPPPPLIVDLGCGVGAGMGYLQHLLEAEIAGITISPVQADIARERLPEALPVYTGDFTQSTVFEELRTQAGRPVDAAWMIESFVHASDPETLLHTLARVIRRGGVLVICDDLRSDDCPDHVLSEHNRRRISEFQQGWHASSFVTGREIVEYARESGFSLLDRRDLSVYVRNGITRGLPVHLAATVGRFINADSPAWNNLRGGSALQHLGRRGIAQYQLLVFRRA